MAAAAHLVGHHAFAALSGPTHRAADDLGGVEREAVFRIAAALHSKAAAHILTDHADLVVGHFEDLSGERRLDAVPRLNRAADGVAAVDGIVRTDTAARLHRVRGDAVDD